jgi:hypothetical protein
MLTSLPIFWFIFLAEDHSLYIGNILEKLHTNCMRVKHILRQKIFWKYNIKDDSQFQKWYIYLKQSLKVILNSCYVIFFQNISIIHIKKKTLDSKSVRMSILSPFSKEIRSLIMYPSLTILKFYVWKIWLNHKLWSTLKQDISFSIITKILILG